jgi:hypothetical protein
MDAFERKYRESDRLRIGDLQQLAYDALTFDQYLDVLALREGEDCLRGRDLVLAADAPHGAVR